ncbi:3-methyl-2-oxobutanoate dehydrogenase subunit VorB [bacterium Unc6]|nr:3-methyl-2-oxobutanoate dehydrogenase subunit VorB [bacterium Unc6]
MKNIILASGNESCGEGAIQSGCRFYAGYPITPQNELTEYMAKRIKEVGGTFIQAESEISSINMVFGASVTGALVMTSSSSPGISLKQEGISYCAGCELPAVIVNMMRGGPGLGNIASAQGDYFQATRGGGHGDYRTITLAPSSVQEMYGLMYDAFYLAVKYRTPVIVLGDSILAQMIEPLEIKKFKSIKIDKEWILDGCKNRKPRIIRSLLLKPDELENLNLRLQGRYREIEKKEIRFEADIKNGTQTLVVSFGTVSRICKAVVEDARKKGINAGWFRPITLWPFPRSFLRKISEKVKKIVVVEMNAGQMLEDIKISVEGRCAIEFYGRMGGNIPDEKQVLRLL